MACFTLPLLSLAQEELPLTDMTGFAEQAGNWKIVGEVLVDRNLDIHQEQASAESSKKKRRRRNKDQTPTPKAVSYEAGTGILLNDPNDSQKDNLLTTWEHGDVRLILQVMMPKGSNSGIYLQGRYELQLLDSWGVETPKFGDIGGIYRNWETEPSKAFAGIAPISNPAKAPGLWQDLYIDFEAPKFDEAGNKISNAKFATVALNGVLIHQNVEVPLPTGGAISNEEAALGPLMIQGDHGPVAFRNLRIQRLKPSEVTLTNLKRQTYLGPLDLAAGLPENELSDPVSVSEIDITTVGADNDYWAVYTGTLEIPEEDNYMLMVPYTGGARLEIDGEVVEQAYATDRRGWMNARKELTAGPHQIRIDNMKGAPWHRAILGFQVGTASTRAAIFNTFDSNPTVGNLVSPIHVNVENEPRLLRGFVFFNNSREKLSHTIGVGTPQGVHYVYDLESGNLVGMWRGEFLDATPMWHSRGNGSFRPNGATVWTFLNQPLAELSDMATAFPGHTLPEGFKSKGYRIDPETKLPVFLSTYGSVGMERSIVPADQGKSLLSTIEFSENGLSGYYYKLAEGSIEELPDGSFKVNDDFYLEMHSNQQPTIREIDGKQELMVAVTGETLKFKTIW